MPLGAVVAWPEVISSLLKGEHTSTFAGNPLACAAGAATLEFIRENDLPGQAARKGLMLMEGLEEIASKGRVVREVRGLGMMLAIELRVDIQRLLGQAMSDRLIFAYSGRNTVRLLPPIVATDDQLRQGLAVLANAVQEEERIRIG